jgi:hypothetical protein
MVISFALAGMTITIAETSIKTKNKVCFLIYYHLYEYLNIDDKIPGLEFLLIKY